MDNKNDFTTGNITKKLLWFMLPILGALLLQAMYGAVDLVIVGQFGTTEGMSGVSTGSNIVNMFVFTLTGLAMGITVLISRYIGEGNSHKIGKVLGGVIAFFSVLAVVISIFMVVVAPLLAKLMQAPESAFSLTVLYIRICGGGMLFVIAYNILSSIFRGLGDSTSPLIFVSIACVVNIIGDLVLVAGLHMNVAGAAIATISAQGVSVILSLFILSKKELPFTFSVKDIGFNPEVLKFLKLGAPIALQEFLTQLSFLAICAFINKIGLDASSGYGVAQKIQSFVMLIPSSLMQSMSSFVGQNVGAKKEKRARQAMFTGMIIGAIIGAFVFVLMMFKAELISSIFTSNQSVIIRSSEYIRGFAIEAVVTSVLFSYMGYFNGHGNTVFVMAQGLIQSFLVRLPFSYIASIQPNPSLTLVGMAAPSATVFGITLCTIYYFRMIKHINFEE